MAEILHRIKVQERECFFKRKSLCSYYFIWEWDFFHYLTKRFTFIFKYSLKGCIFILNFIIIAGKKSAILWFHFSYSHKSHQKKNENGVLRSNGVPCTPDSSRGRWAWRESHELQIIRFCKLLIRCFGERRKHVYSPWAPSDSEQSQKLPRKDSMSHFKFLQMANKGWIKNWVSGALIWGESWQHRRQQDVLLVFCRPEFFCLMNVVHRRQKFWCKTCPGPLSTCGQHPSGVTVYHLTAGTYVPYMQTPVPVLLLKSETITVL